MILDSSAVIAVLRDEPDADPIADVIEHSLVRRISAATFLESAIVIDCAGNDIASDQFDEFLSAANVIIEPVTKEQAHLARQAYARFGKGSGHAAQLNFGDCFAYALAKDKGEPLLFKGRDFSHTDVMPALK